MRVILKREFKAYFNTASGFIFMTVFLIISGIFFALTNLFTGDPYYNPVLDSTTFIFLILVPMITMKALAEEKHQKIDQLLLTSPVRLSEIVLGKYFAAVGLFLITLALTCIYPIILGFYGPISIWEIVGDYIGFALLGSAFISIGIFVSSLTENQITAAVGTFGALLLIWIIDWMQQGLPTTLGSGIAFAALLVIIVSVIVYYAVKNTYFSFAVALLGGIAMAAVYIINKALYEGFTAKFLGWFSLTQRYQSFTMGILDVSTIIYYITFSAAFLFLTIRVLDKRRWS